MPDYYDVKNVPAIDNALDFPADVLAQEGTNAQKRKRKLNHINQLGLPGVPVDVRVSTDGTRCLMEVTAGFALSVPTGLILAGPMTRDECLAYLKTQPTWSE
jgi:hypothetical protein